MNRIAVPEHVAPAGHPPNAESERPEQYLLEALADADCRAILAATAGGAKTADELATECDIPQSTTYRKLEFLRQLGLLDERTRIREHGKHPTEYVCAVDRVTVDVGEALEVTVRD